jgi:hypothetical protein
MVWEASAGARVLRASLASGREVGGMSRYRLGTIMRVLFRPEDALVEEDGMCYLVVFCD